MRAPVDAAPKNRWSCSRAVPAKTDTAPRSNSEIRRESAAPLNHRARHPAPPHEATAQRPQRIDRRAPEPHARPILKSPVGDEGNQLFLRKLEIISPVRLEVGNVGNRLLAKIEEKIKRDLFVLRHEKGERGHALPAAHLRGPIESPLRPFLKSAARQLIQQHPPTPSPSSELVSQFICVYQANAAIRARWSRVAMTRIIYREGARNAKKRKQNTEL